MSKEIVPIPVVTGELITDIKKEVNKLESTISCEILKNYFKYRIFNGNQCSTQTNFSEADFVSIKSMFGNLKLCIPNINKVLDYYIINYPAYQCLQQRCLSQTFNEQSQTDKERVVNQWLQEFLIYLKLKLAEVCKLATDNTQKDASTMTNSPKSDISNISSFCLEITGPNNIINNLVFSTMNDDVVVRYHKNQHSNFFKQSKCMVKALMNYPNIQIVLNIGTYSTPLLSVTRSCECLYDRFIVNEYTNAQKEILSNLKSINKRNSSRLDSRIQSVELVEAKESTPYTHGFINDYVCTLFNLIKNCSERVPCTRKEELQLFLLEFLADIVEMNLYNRSVIATNTVVKFLITSTNYERYRFVRKNDINFIETLSPVITLHFKEFNPLHAVDAQQNLYFKQLRLFAQNLNSFEDVIVSEHTIRYNCTLCGTSYDCLGIIAHILDAHEPEVGVVCEKCQLSFEVASLSARRWKHTCFE